MKPKLRKLQRIPFSAPIKFKKKRFHTTSFNIKGWTAIRETILERDNYECRICGRSAGEETLHVHHIDWERRNNEDSNLVTLCNSCHRQVHFERYKPSDYPDYKTPW